MIRLGQLVLTVLVTWLIVDRVGLGMDDLRSVDPALLWSPDPVLLAGSCVLLLAGYFFSAGLWGRIVRDLGGPVVPIRDAVRIFMIANLGRYVPGKVWQIAGLAVLARRRGVPPATATGAAVLGQGIALVAATAVGLGALLRGPDELRSWGLVAVAGMALAVALGLTPPVFRRASALWFRLARQEAPENLNSSHPLRWLGLFFANWVLYAFSFWVLSTSFGHRADLIPVGSAFAAAYVLGYLMIFAPAGLGVREGFLVAFLTPHLGLGPSGALAVVARIWTTVVEVVPAAAFWARHVATPAGSAPAGSAPAGSAPAGSAPAGSAPVGDAPVGDAPVGDGAGERSDG